MRYRNTHESLRVLYALAVSQCGYFTAKQAASAGYDYIPTDFAARLTLMRFVGRDDASRKSVFTLRLRRPGICVKEVS